MSERRSSSSCSSAGVPCESWTPSCTGRTAWAAGSRSSEPSSAAATSATRRPAASALEDVDALVHLAAIVGDPACARDPELAQAVNVEATRHDRGRGARGGRPAHGLRLDLLELRADGGPDGRGRRDGRRWRRSRSTPSRRSRSRRCCCQAPRRRWPPTCLRFATVYGVGAADALRPHGQRVHPRSLGRPRPRGVRRAVLAPVRARPRRCPRHHARCWRPVPRQIGGEVFNVGHSDENYRKLDLVEIITGQLGAATCSYVAPGRGSARLQGGVRQGPRAARASSPRCGCRTACARSAQALDDDAFGDPWAGAYRNTP